MGLHPSKEQISETIARRQRVKKRLKMDLSDKKAAGESFTLSADPKTDLSSKTKDQQPQRRLRKHFHERP